MGQSIGETLKKCRIKAGKSVKEISDLLISKGFKASEKTIYSWEKNNSQPTPGALLIMCKAYGINDVLETFGYGQKKNSDPVSEMSIDGATIKRNISKNIVKYREKMGYSQKELANKLGVTPSRISNWEQGANCPTIDILFEVCKILQVSINDIYGIYPDSNVSLSYGEKEHIENYRLLDEYGKELIDTITICEVNRSKDLEESKRRLRIYQETFSKLVNEQKQKNSSITKEEELLAAHQRTDIEVTPEGIQNDLDIMNDDNLWK